VSDDRRAPDEYRWARQVSAILLIAVGVVVVVLGVEVAEYDVSPPVLVPFVRFTSNAQAFVLVDDRMFVVAVWRPESDPSVAPYGGASRLLKGFLSTMHLVPGAGHVMSPSD
jgi:hypothetical protein